MYHAAGKPTSQYDYSLSLEKKSRDERNKAKNCIMLRKEFVV